MKFLKLFTRRTATPVTDVNTLLQQRNFTTIKDQHLRRDPLSSGGSRQNANKETLQDCARMEIAKLSYRHLQKDDNGEVKLPTTPRIEPTRMF